MRQNFAAWNLRHEDFDTLPKEARAAFLIRFAVLAPSSHNSQPWSFAVSGDDITVRADLSRALPFSDADHRQMYISIGCAIENLLLAAEYYGYAAAVSHFDEGGAPAWRISLTGTPAQPQSRPSGHPATLIAARVTNRGKYDSRMPSSDFLSWMRTWVGDDEVHCVDANPLKDQVVDVVSGALLEAMDDVGFRTELSAYIRPNVTKAMTGMPMYGFGMPTPPSFLAPTLVRFVNVNRLSRKADEALLREHTPMLVTLCTRNDGVQDWVRAGRLFQRITMEAMCQGLSAAPLAAAIQIGSNFVRLQKCLGTGLRPQVLFRLGYATEPPPHSPRIPAENVTVSRF